MVNTLRDWLVWRRRGGAGDAVLLIAREVTDRLRSVQGGLAEIRQPAILDGLTAEDFLGLDQVIVEQDEEDHEYAIVLARLTHAAARFKGFDEAVVDAALRLDSLLPGDDPSRERDRLLRDAYNVAQQAGYVEGGRVALGRLGHRALEAGESERARLLLQQQLDLGDEEDDTIGEIDAALALGDLLRREGDRAGAQMVYRRAGRSAQRLDYQHGIAEALIRQIELMPRETDLEMLAALQRQASEAARRTVDLGLQSRIVLSLAETLRRNGKRDEAVSQLQHGLEIARQIGDLALEARCLAALAESEQARGRPSAVALHERAMIDLEERLGNRQVAGDWATRHGATLLGLGQLAEAIDAFGRALTLATAAGDLKVEQRALGGLGVAYTLVDRPADALEHLMRALDLARRTRDQRHEARWLGSIGQTLWRYNQPDDAIRALTDGLAIARHLDDAELQANLLTLLGQIHAARGQPPRARECFNRALDLYRRLGQSEEQVSLLSALAGLAAEAGQISGAVALGEQALQLATITGNRVAAARLHGRLGQLARRRYDQQLALDHFRKAVTLSEGLDHPALLSQALQHLATSQHAAKDPTAVATYRRALAHCQASGDTTGEALMQLNLGLLLSGDGHREEGRLLLREAALLAADLGPRGADLARRAEAALTALPPEPARDDLGRVSRPPVVAAGEPGDGTDAVFRETTLPPL